MNPRFPDLIHEIIKQCVVKEHLRRQKIAARIDLFLQMADIVLLAGILRMTFGITGCADAKIPGRANVRDQLGGVAVLPGHIIRRQVPPQGKDIFDARRFKLRQACPHHPPIAGNAGQMGQRCHPQARDFFRDGRRVLARAAAGAVGHAHIGRRQRRDFPHRLSHRFQPGVRLWRKHLKGEHRPIRSQLIL